jgi:uncharacterized tellurite resistance protein B-like protein
MALFLTQSLGQSLLGALYSICRADGEVSEAEAEALRAEARELGVGALSEESLFFSEVTPAALAEAVRGAAAEAYRSAAVSPPSAIRSAFRVAAERIARADGTLGDAEASLIARFDEELAALDPGLPRR